MSELAALIDGIFLAEQIKDSIKNTPRAEYSYEEAYEALQTLQIAVTEKHGLDVLGDPELTEIMNAQTERLIRGLRKDGLGE